MDAVPALAVSDQPMTRPVCLYPGRVRYKGSGSIYDASNFKCANGPTGTGYA